MKKILFFLLTLLLTSSVWAQQFNFLNADKEAVEKYYNSFPASTALKDCRLNPEINPEIKIIDADSSSEVIAAGHSLFKEKWTYSYYLGTTEPTYAAHGFVNNNKYYLLMISANRQRGRLYLRTASRGYDEICTVDIASIRGRLTEIKDIGNNLVIAKILQIWDKKISPAYLVIDLATKRTEAFE